MRPRRSADLRGSCGAPARVALRLAASPEGPRGLCVQMSSNASECSRARAPGGGRREEGETREFYHSDLR